MASISSRVKRVASDKADVDLILTQAVGEFAEHGFEGMSMRVLAEKCKVSTMAIYYHFGSKEDLYAEVCRRRFDDITHLMRERLRREGSTGGRLDAFVGTLFDEWHRDRILLLLTQRDVINALVNPQHVNAESHHAQLTGLLHDLLTAHFGAAMDKDLTFTVGSLIYGYCSMMSFDRKVSKLDPERYLQHRKQVLLQCCRRIWGGRPLLG